MWEGERVRLRAVEPGDVDAFRETDEDTDGVRAGWRLHPPRSVARSVAWFDAESSAQPDGDDFRVVIEALASGEAVGTLNTNLCNPVNGTCSYGVAVFPWHRRQG